MSQSLLFVLNEPCNILIVHLDREWICSHFNVHHEVLCALDPIDIRVLIKNFPLFWAEDADFCLVVSLNKFLSSLN
jgi:hypothetical protein